MAADRTFDVSVVLGLVDKMSSGLKQIDNSISATQKTLGSLAVAGLSIYAMTNYLKSAVVASAQEEAAMFRLRAAVEQSGKSWIFAESSLSEFLITTQKTTKYAGDQIIPGLQKLITFTNDTAKAMNLMTLATDLAAYSNVELGTAVQAITQAQQGNVRILGMLIPGMRGLDKEMLGLSDNASFANYAMRTLQNTVGGFAQKELKQTEAMMAQASVKTNNLAQDIGKKLEPATRFIIMAFSEFIDFMRRVVDSTYLVEVGMGLLITAIVAVGVAMAAALPQVTLVATAWGLLATAVTTSITALADWIVKAKSSKDVYEEQAANVQKVIDKNNDEIASLIAKQIEYGKDSVKYGEYQTQINTLLNSNILLRKSLHADDKSNAVTAVAETTTAMIVNWTAYYNALDGMAKLSASAGLSYIDVYKAGAEKSSQELLDNWSKTALLYSSISDGIKNHSLTKTYEQIAAEKRAYNEGIMSIAENWEKYMYQMDGSTTTWVNDFIYASKEILAITEYFTTGIGDLSRQYYQLRTIEANNWQEDELNRINDLYTAEKNRIETTVMDRAEMDSQLAELDRNYLNQKTQIDRQTKEKLRKEKEEQRKWAVAEAEISGALAIIKTFAAYGFTPIGIGAAALQVAQTAMQVSIIQAQRYATGVMGSMGGIALVGEQGPELVNLPQGSDVYNASTTRSMLASAGSGMQINLNISGNYIMNQNNARELADVISNIIVGRVKKERLI